MVLRRALLLLAVALVPPASYSQAPPVPADVKTGANLSVFDVVSVKPVQPTGRPMGMTAPQYTADGIRWQSVTLSALLRQAYGGFAKLPLEESVSGLPEWAKAEYFAVQAKLSEAQAAELKQLSTDQQQQRREVMLQALLADRFKLKEHPETKQVPDYELTVAKGGPKFIEGDANSNGLKDRNGKPIVGSFLRQQGLGNVEAQLYSMEQLASFLTQPFVGVGRIVKDKTGLTGSYSFALNFAPTSGSAPGPVGETQTPEDPRPAIFTALQDQLGLKLQTGTATIEVLVVDHVERPTQD